MTESLAATPRLDKDGSVAVLSLGAGENRFNLDSVRALDALLTEVEQGSFTALVTTAEGKIWSNGFDTPWIAANRDLAPETVIAGERLLARMLTFPVPTVAAIGGHCFAAGLLYALAHDLRVMRADRGFVCLPEVTFGAVFTPGMNDLLTARLNPSVAHRAIVLGQRFGGPDAVAAGIVDEAVAEDEVVARAVALAGAHAGNGREAVSALKRQLYAKALGSLGQPTPPGLLQALVDLESGRA
ncbi:enoyl-CoA hydratase-related protein [Sporichthya brevicatena]|uniref:Enoyl-CoA hydratase-related protein n=1 Tax=Sporichthya brevicatena TaxID=171442 RepID=A0ABN1GGS2_9ACTN